MSNLFKWGKFVTASGKTLDWKIESDALTDEDWECLAVLALDIIGPFRKVYGVPNGGTKFAEALRKYEDPKAYVILLVDDVYTTGSSIRKYVKNFLFGEWPDEVLVVFDRSEDYENPDDVRSIFQVNRCISQQVEGKVQ